MVDHAMSGCHDYIRSDVLLGFFNDYQLWGMSLVLTSLQNSYLRINIRLRVSIDRRQDILAAISRGLLPVVRVPLIVDDSMLFVFSLWTARFKWC
jgi:hypothetical protein